MTTATLDIYTTIDSIIAANHAAKEVEARDLEARKQRAIEDEINALKGRINATFGEELIKALGMKISRKGDIIRAAFTFDGIPYRLWWNPQYSRQNPWSIGQHDYANDHFSDENAADNLLRYLANEREKRAQWAEQAAANEQHEAEVNARKAEQEAAKQAMHERIAAMVETHVNERRAALWPWPAGTTATIYHWRWQTSGGYNDGEYSAEYDEGYATTDELDDRGYVVLMPQRYRNSERTVKLNPMAHKPIVERITVASVDDLPNDLVETITTKIDGIGETDDYYGGPRYFVETEGGYFRSDVGKEPLPWVVALIEESR